MSPIPLGILAASGGAGAAYELISTQVLSSSASSVTFSSIPQTYKHLQVRMVGRASSTFGQYVYGYFNNDLTDSNYTNHTLNGSGSSVSSSGGSSGSLVARFSGTENTNLFSPSVLEILDYTSTSKNTTMRALVGRPDSYPFIGLVSSLWKNTSAVTSVRFEMIDSSNFVTGSRFSLYGIRG